MSIEDRDRLAEARDYHDRRRSRRGLGTVRQLVQVYDGGSIPTAVPAVFMTHPATIGVAEAEGTTPGLTAGGDVIPVLVLGPRVPVAGDLLIASIISGRWVGEMQGGALNDCPCSPCHIPKTNLDLFSLVGGTPTFVGQLVRTPECGPWDWTNGDQRMRLECTAGVIEIRYALFAEDFTNTIVLDFTCDPFHFHVGAPDGSFWYINAP